MRGALAALATLAIAFLTPVGAASASAAAELPRPINLQVEGGETSWHASNSFRLEWEYPAVATAAVDLRLSSADGKAADVETRLPFDVNWIDPIEVPAGPGRYSAEVWLEDPRGERGPPERATLLFDDVRPQPVRPLTAAGWIAGNSAASVRIEQPPVPLPVSGIRGYAVSVSRDGGKAPCARPSRCSEEETDLAGGIDDSTASLGLLPEGTNVVRAVAVSTAGVSSEEGESAIVRVDATEPSVALQGAPSGWAHDPVRLTATASDDLSGMAAAGAAGPFTALAVDDGPAKIGEGDSVSVVLGGDGAHAVAFYARDAAGNVRDGSGSRLPPTEIVRIDESPPEIAFARSQDPADPERIEATVVDPLSGPDPIRGSIALRPAGSRQRFEPISTTVSAGRLTGRWDSDSFPAGDYEFKATGFDAAGNSAESERRSSGARMVLSNPLKAATRLEAGFGGRRLVWRSCTRTAGRRHCHRRVSGPYEQRPAMRTIPYGHGAQFSGRLTSVAGIPLGGMPIQVIESFDPGAPAPGLRTTTVQTAADGTFATRLAPGPSRQVEAAFNGDRVLTRAGAEGVRLGVLAGVWLHASAATAKVGGEPVVFSGSVGGSAPSVPAAGRPVELQFRLPGSHWAEFRTVQTDVRGRFRYAYAFSDDDSRGARFQFRAHVPAGPDWPYEPASSRPLLVLGR